MTSIHKIPTKPEHCVPNATHTCFNNNEVQRHTNFGRTNETHLQMSYRAVSRKEWSGAEVTVKDGVLTAFGEIVMADDEQEYMSALAKQVVKGQKGKGVILEIGFGMGISASAIQKEGCSRHVIIEANDAILKKMQRWITEKASKLNPTGVVIPMKGFWESVTQHLETASFDGVFYDPFPSSITVPFLLEARRLLRSGGRLSFYSQVPLVGPTPENQWRRERSRLRKAGWTKSEIRAPRYLTLEIKDSCPEFPKCSLQNVTFIVVDVVRGKEGDFVPRRGDDTVYFGLNFSKLMRGLERLPGVLQGKLKRMLGGSVTKPTARADVDL